MKMLIFDVPASHLVRQMSLAAKQRYVTEGAWAKASGVPKETLSRLKSQRSCDLRTLNALAGSAGFTLAVVPSAAGTGAHVPDTLGRREEDELLDLAASENVDPSTWRTHGPAFFMGGLAVLLASARGFERGRYLKLAEALHPGVSTVEVFQMWLDKTPVRASRFLPMARKRKRLP